MACVHVYSQHDHTGLKAILKYCYFPPYINTCSIWILLWAPNLFQSRQEKCIFLRGWFKWHNFSNSSPTSNLVLHPNNSGNSQQMRIGPCGWIQITPPFKKRNIFVPAAGEKIAVLLFIMTPTIMWSLCFSLPSNVRISAEEQLVFVFPQYSKYNFLYFFNLLHGLVIPNN